MIMPNKRKQERHSSTDTLYIISGENIIKASLIDISVSGIRFSADEKIDEEKLLNININYHPANFIQKGFVVWSKNIGIKWEYGAAFANVSPVNNILLEDYIQMLTSSVR